MAVNKAKTAAEETNAAEVVTTTAAAEKTQETANTAAEEVVKMVYIGPTLPAGKLKCNRIIEGTESQIKESLADVIEEYPLVERMLVPVGQLAEKKNKVRTAGNILNKYYADIESMIAAKEREV